MEFQWEKLPVLSNSKVARVFSPVNIALSKYWGKRDLNLNLPTNGSISTTLKDFGSFTTVEFNSKFTKNEFILNGKKQRLIPPKIERIVVELKKKAKVEDNFRIQSRNNLPTGAGLASSASGLSAVALATTRALNLKLSKRKLSEIARKGSGSACRSLFDGFVEWRKGSLKSGSDSVARSLASFEHWPLKIFIAVISNKEKKVSSTEGMERTRKTSPYFSGWASSSEKNLAKFRRAIRERDFSALANLTEENCLQMHASAMGAVPPVIYFEPKTLEVIETVRNLRESGVHTFFTIDAGPNVVVFCEPKDEKKTLKRLRKITGIELLETAVGKGARLVN